MSTDRELDVVLFGATSFVGRLCAEYLSRAAPSGARIGLAGRSRERLRDLRTRLARHVEPPHTRASVRRPEQREFAREDYLAAVARAKQYITAGDVFQVQIGQRITKQFADAPLSLYRIFTVTGEVTLADFFQETSIDCPGSPI